MSRRPSQKLVVAKKDKQTARAGPSSQPQPADTDPENPWPRNDGEPFNHNHMLSSLREPNITVESLRSHCKFPRPLGAPWNDYNSIFYNRWLRVTIKRTPVVCRGTLESMGIRDEVVAMLGRMGLGTLPYKTYPVYRELVIQFYSSISIHHEDGTDPEDARNYFLAFMIRGKEYRLPIPRLCSLYGFDSRASERDFPANVTQYPVTLWHAIGTDSSTPREFKITMIRNPVIRVVAKIIGTVFFGREETGSVALSDLTLIHYGLPSSAHAIYPANIYATIPPSLQINLGYQLAQSFFTQRTKGLSVSRKGKDDFMGSLLTPIFRAVSISLGQESRSGEDCSFFDLQYFLRARILRGDAQTYAFSDSRGDPHTVKLPVPGFTNPDTPAALEFDIPPALYIDTPTGRRRTRTSHRQASTSATPAQASTPPSFPDPTAIMGAFQWEHVSDDIAEGWPAYHRNMRAHASRMERAVRWLLCGGCSSGGEPGESSHPAAGATQDEPVEHDDASDGVAGTRETQTYHRRRRPHPEDTHSASTDEGV